MSVIIQDNYAYEILNKNLSMEMTGMLANEQLFDKQLDMNDIFRNIVNDWIFEINNAFKLTIKTYHLSVTYFDILLQRKNIRTSNIQKYGSACLSLASKMNEIYSPEINDYVHVSDNNYSVEELEEAERKVYDILNHKLIVPTLYNFVELYINLLKRNNNFTWTEDEQYLTNGIISFISMISTSSLKYLPSLIALCSIIVSKEYFDQETNYNELINLYFVDYSFSHEDLVFGYLFIRTSMNSYNTTKFTSVKKYINKKIVDINIGEYFSHIIVPNIENNNLLRPEHQYVKNEILRIEQINKVKKIGGGEYGNVYKIRINDDFKAFKSMFCEIYEGIDASIIREISILNYVSHANLLDLVRSTYNSKKKCYGVVFEFMDTDLDDIINVLTDYHIKRFSSQLLQAVEYLHSSGIIHRDIKPSNILIKGNDIKLSDYGISRPMVSETGIYTPRIVDFNGRPIENFLGIQRYGFSSDIWSCACVIGRMIKKETLFIEYTDIGMIFKIMRLFGYKRIEEVYSSLPEWRIHFPKFEGENMKDFLNTDDDLVAGLLEYMFEIDNTKRPTAKMILNHPWFMS